MTERDPLHVLTELVAPFDSDPNGWDDVLRRAHAPSPPRQPGRPRRRWAMPARWQLRTAVGVLAAAAVIATPTGRAGAEWVAGLVELGDSPTSHENIVPGESRQAYVIATGRAPDGGRFELVLDRYAHGTEIADGEQVDSCLTLEWPDSGKPGAQGFCGPGFPPPQNGGRAPGGAPARPFGFLSPYQWATRDLALVGFTDPDVKRVAVTYPTADGTRENAPVDLIELPAELQRRIGSIEPVNVFVAFLPSSAGAGPKESSKTLEVLAYDAAGRELGRVRHTNQVNPWVEEGPAPEPMGG
jgi:hypothetical protein